MFDRVLVANRGEIAARICRTLRAMGIEPIGVHAADDEGQPHTRLVDRSIELGSGPPTQTYLDHDAIVDAAVETGSDAVHPGYGFGSEDPALARAVEQAGLVWIGPPPEALAALGDKARALAMARKLGVPTTPGSEQALPSLETARSELERIGTPAVLKATHGGGGMGMVQVDTLDALDAAWTEAREQAASAFGSPDVILERWWQAPRHVEVQIAFDQRGQGVHLLERECSLQRRHQKLVEEAPAPCVDAKLRTALTRDALRIGEAAGVVNLATVEFLVVEGAKDGYVFNEVNPRLQVEHPATEAITGTDLVEWQVRLAAGEPLPLSQGEIRADGWAVEARVNAEDPLDAFKPAPGPITHVHVPQGEGLRVDHALVPGGRVSPRYDSLVAKVIAHGEDRATALERCRAGLAELRVGGRPTTAGFLHHLLALDTVQAGQMHTGLIDQALLEGYASRVHGAMAALVGAYATVDEGIVTLDGHEATYKRTPAGIEIAGERCSPLGEVRSRSHVALEGRGLEGRVQDALPEPPSARLEGEHIVEAPIAGTVRAVPVEAGEQIEEGSVLVVIEAMKMNNRVGSPAPGRVVERMVSAGQQVDPGDPLVRIEAGS